MFFAYVRTLLVYLVLVGGMRLLGKRQIGQMGPAEFVVTMLIANLASIPLADPGVPLISGVLPMLTVLGAELVLNLLTLRSVRLRRLLCGKPVILIEKGVLRQDRLRSTRITLDELTGRLRDRGILDLSQVDYAILETGGSLSVFPKDRPPTAKELGVQAEDQDLPLTLIEDGRLLGDNLEKSGRDLAWVEKTLRDRGGTVAGTLILTAEASGKLLWIPREKP